MAKKFHSVFIIGLLYLSFVSCGTKYSQEILLVDSLQVELTKVQNDLNAVDATQLVSVNIEMLKKLTFIQSNYNDTIDKKLAQTLDEYNMLRQSLEMVIKNGRELSATITLSQKRLNDLKHDLQNNIPTKEKVMEYCKDERREIERIKIYVALIRQTGDEKIKLYNSTRGGVDEVERKLNEK